MDENKISGTMSDAELAAALSGVRLGYVAPWGELYRRFAPAIFRFAGARFQRGQTQKNAGFHW
jgi:hypothetical protein